MLLPALLGVRACEPDGDIEGDGDGGLPGPTDAGPMDAGPPGDAGPSDAGSPVYEPCGARSCGDTCTVCAPDDSSCVETPADELCQPDGTCAAAAPICPESRDYYYWDFEDDDGGWTTSGNIGEGCGGATDPCVPGTSWEWGVPTGREVNPFITSAAEGSRAWVTNLSGDFTEFQFSSVDSPRMDFSALTEDPVLDLRFIADVIGVYFYYSVDGGDWQPPPGTLGWPRAGEPEPASRGFYAGYDGGYGDELGSFMGVSGAPGVWVRGQIVLVGAAGSSNVRISFYLEDDFDTSPGFGIDEVRVRSGGIDGPPDGGPPYDSPWAWTVS